MILPIAPLVHDHLDSTAHFVSVGPEDEVKGHESILREGESIVGWYQNPAPSKASIVFTDRALLFTDAGSTWRLPYLSISSWRPHSDEQGTVDGLEVQCGGQTLVIPCVGVHGEDGQARDALCFAKILSAVIQAPREQLVA